MARKTIASLQAEIDRLGADRFTAESKYLTEKKKRENFEHLANKLERDLHMAKSEIMALCVDRARLEGALVGKTGSCYLLDAVKASAVGEVPF